MKKGIVEVQIAKKIVKRKKNYNATSDALPGPELKKKKEERTRLLFRTRILTIKKFLQISLNAKILNDEN